MKAEPSVILDGPHGLCRERILYEAGDFESDPASFPVAPVKSLPLAEEGSPRTSLAPVVPSSHGWRCHLKA